MFGVFSLFIVVLLISNVIAITGAIGNARMILRVNEGDEIEKYVLVKNVNEVKVDIIVSASGDLQDYIDIKDKEFSLNAGDEKKAYFIIKVPKEGTTESKINVQFTPDEGNGVGLSSTVIVIAEDTGEGNWFTDWLNRNDDSEDNPENNDSVTIGTGNVVNSGNDGGGMSPVAIGLSVTAIIFLILVILLAIAANKKGKSKSKKNVKKSG